MKYNTNTLSVLFLTLVLLSTSCSNFRNPLNGDVLESNSIPYQLPVKKSYCKNTTTTQIHSHSSKLHKRFYSFAQNFNLSFIESLAILVFIQLKERPDIATPNSILSGVVKGEYILFNSAQNYSLFNSLEHLLKKHKSPRDLKYLAYLFDNNFPNDFSVTKEFSRYLEQNKEKIQKSPRLNKLYTRAGEILKENEKLPKQNISQLIKLFLSKNKKQKKDFKGNSKKLLTQNAKSDPQCSFSLIAYQKNNFSPSKNSDNSLVFSFKMNQKAALLAFTNFPDLKTTIKKTVFFSSSSRSLPPNICLMNKKSLKTWVMSSHSRDSAQHLTNVIDSNIFKARTKNEIDIVIREPRSLLLNSPNRIVFESERAHGKVPKNLFAKKLPIYSSPNLGAINVLLDKGDNQNLIIDDRLNNHLSCL